MLFGCSVVRHAFVVVVWDALLFVGMGVRCGGRGGFCRWAVVVGLAAVAVVVFVVIVVAMVGGTSVRQTRLLLVGGVNIVFSFLIAAAGVARGWWRLRSNGCSAKKDFK